MSLVWNLADDGAFICGDLDSRVTSYSYPTSQNASDAARAARKSGGSVQIIAFRILNAEKRVRYGAEHEAEYDARNWRRLNSEMEA
jgi:hypothetical protein